MKFFPTVVLGLLVFLAISSGLTKILLMPQDVEFFGKYGFTNFLLILFGAVQVIGGLLLIFLKMRILGAAIVAVTFATSAVILILAGSVAATIATLVALGLLGWTIRHTLATK
ncbi:MAG: hypothetical protein ABJM43_02750 [Paracoccaceae bacterium]